MHFLWVCRTSSFDRRRLRKVEPGWVCGHWLYEEIQPCAWGERELKPGFDSWGQSIWAGSGQWNVMTSETAGSVSPWEVALGHSWRGPPAPNDSTMSFDLWACSERDAESRKSLWLWNSGAAASTVSSSQRCLPNLQATPALQTLTIT